jgi:hypothetical protein
MPNPHSDRAARPIRYVIRREPLTRSEVLALGWTEDDLHTHPWPRVVHAYAIHDDGHEPRRVRHHVRHSPSGFEFGYEGSGPAELARCLLIDYFDAHERADDLDGESLPVSYQQFKREFIARVPQASPPARSTPGCAVNPTAADRAGHDSPATSIRINAAARPRRMTRGGCA